MRIPPSRTMTAAGGMATAVIRVAAAVMLPIISVILFSIFLKLSFILSVSDISYIAFYRLNHVFRNHFHELPPDIGFQVAIYVLVVDRHIFPFPDIPSLFPGITLLHIQKPDVFRIGHFHSGTAEDFSLDCGASGKESCQCPGLRVVCRPGDYRLMLQQLVALALQITVNLVLELVSKHSFVNSPATLPDGRLTMQI